MTDSFPSATGYSLWLRPYGDLAYKLKERIDKYSEEFGTPSFEPHLTLLGGLKQNETELISMTKVLASRLHPFDINLTTVSYDDEFYRSLYVLAEKSESIMEAHKTARRLFLDEDDASASDFLPHLSLMYSNMDRNEKLRMINNHGKNVNSSFEVHGVMLVKTEGTPDEWEEIHSERFEQE
jgi:2'-5' RNA ligase